MRDYSFGNFISAMRERSGLSQYQLGALVGVSDKAVSKWENGVSKPRLSKVRRLAEIFDVHLVFCFEKAGVLRDENDDDSVVPEINRATYAELLEQGIVNGGMIPKLDNAFAAIDAGVTEVIITKASALNDLSKGSHLV